MKNALGYACAFGGVIAGLYCGLWWAFIGGFIQAVVGAIMTPVDTADVVLGLLRMAFAAPIGWVVLLVFCAAANELFKE